MKTIVERLNNTHQLSAPLMFPLLSCGVGAYYSGELHHRSFYQFRPDDNTVRRRAFRVAGEHRESRGFGLIDDPHFFRGDDDGLGDLVLRAAPVQSGNGDYVSHLNPVQITEWGCLGGPVTCQHHIPVGAGSGGSRPVGDSLVDDRDIHAFPHNLIQANTRDLQSGDVDSKALRERVHPGSLREQRGALGRG